MTTATTTTGTSITRQTTIKVDLLGKSGASSRINGWRRGRGRSEADPLRPPPCGLQLVGNWGRRGRRNLRAGTKQITFQMLCASCGPACCERAACTLSNTKKAAGGMLWLRHACSPSVLSRWAARPHMGPGGISRPKPIGGAGGEAGSSLVRYWRCKAQHMLRGWRQRQEGAWMMDERREMCASRHSVLVVCACWGQHKDRAKPCAPLSA